MTMLPVLPGISIRLIQRIVADRFGLPIDIMESPSRLRRNAHPRQLAMRLSREFTGKSLPTIGRYFGGRDHTTILWAIKSTEDRIASNPAYRADVEQIRAVLLDRCLPKTMRDGIKARALEQGLVP